ncbi:MAG: hypothetical protein UDC79_02790 [Acutalibacteraceae bacterium]|nr:hypothetical protein [Acutalibacteraceae bacterium]
MKNKGLKIALKILLALLVAGILFGIYFITRLSFIGPAISSGKYSHLGENLTSIILIAAYLCACITIFFKKKRLVSGIVSFILIISVIPALGVANTVVAAKEYQTFNQEIWNDPEYYNCRQYMIDDIKSKYGLVGMDVKEVKNILGENSYDSPEDNEFYYEIGQEFPGYKKFIITYDENGKVTKVETTNDARRG